MCPVKTECLEFALTTNQQHGIWGGLALDERRRQKSYRVIYCNHCSRRFTWPPEDGKPPPRFCSGACRRASRLASKSRSHSRRKVEAE